MKFLVSLSIVLVAYLSVNGQESSIASRIAKRMRDSLYLNEAQYKGIDSVNRLLDLQKVQARQQYNQPDSLRVKIQLIENSRDGLYRPILGEQRYSTYRQRKNTLVNNQ